MDIGKRYSKYFAEKYDKLNLNQKDFVTKIQKIRTTGNDVVKKYLSQKDVAPWFRGTSHYHIQGADKLLNALRDDAEQRTTHRVRSCLNLIGLEPMITSKQITFLMRLSRGSDLVFLWFLMEMHYKTPKNDVNSYSVNEQLICSAICHLDMVTTLRELDKILPSGHTSRLEMKKASLKRQERRESFKKRNNERVASKYVLPYFEKTSRPQHYGKRLLLEVPNFKVNFDFYSHYGNLNHNVPNESNRWYADYRFNPVTRIVHLIIRETITNIFYNFEAASLKSRTIDVLCDYHKTVKSMESNLDHELKVKRRDDCLDRYFMSRVDKDKRANTTTKLLYNAVQVQLCKLNNQTRKTVPKNASLKTITSDGKIVDVILANNFNGHCNDSTNKTGDAINFKAKNLKKEKYNLNRDFNKKYGMYKNEFRDIFGSSYGNKNANEHKNLETTNVIHLRTSHTNEFDKMCEINYYNLGNGSGNASFSDIRTPSDIFFNRAMMHKPFKFYYEKIFLPKYQEDEKIFIQKMFLAALQKTILTDLDQSDLKYDEVIRKCAKNTFDNEVRKYEEDMKDVIEAEAAENQKTLSQYPTLANYNAEDYALMDRMLFDAFQYLRKNPKFVWAQLPDAHKVPILREWIARRFGKEYTLRERANSYRNSCKIFRALNKKSLKSSIPNANQIGRNPFLNYNCRTYLDKKVRHIKNNYYYRLDSSFLEYTRVFWFAMRGYICSNGPPRKTFFAYMPSRLRDIHHFRLWKSSEYRNFKVTWNTRRFKSRNAYF